MVYYNISAVDVAGRRESNQTMGTGAGARLDAHVAIHRLLVRQREGKLSSKLWRPLGPSAAVEGMLDMGCGPLNMKDPSALLLTKGR